MSTALSAFPEFAEVLRAGTSDDVSDSVPWGRLGWTDAGPVWDIGAGSGRTTAALLRAGAAPQGVVAIEPDPQSRALLLQRLALDPGLRRHVTVEHRPFADVPSSENLRGIVLISVVEHLSEQERLYLFTRAAAMLAPSGSIVMNRTYGPSEETVAETLVGTAQVGRDLYFRFFAAAPDDGAVRVRNTYRVVRDGEVLRHEVEEKRVQRLSEERVIAEAEACGLVPIFVDDHFMTLSPR